MATVIDSLLISIGIDPAQLVKGAKETDEALKKVGDRGARTGKDVEASARKMAEGLSRVRSEVIGLFASFATAAGLGAFLKDITAADSSVGRFSENIGASAKDVAAFQGAVERMGGTAAGALSTLQNWASNVYKAQHGLAPEFIGWERSLEALSGKTVQVTGPIKEQLASLADAFQSAFAKNPVAAQMLATNMGLADSFNLLKQGRAKFNAEMSKSTGLGVPSQADIDAAQARLDAWKSMVEAWADTGRKIATDFTPAILGAEHALPELAEWAKANPDLADRIAALAVAFTIFKTLTIPLALVRALSSLGATAKETAASLDAVAASAAGALAVPAAVPPAAVSKTVGRIKTLDPAMAQGTAVALGWSLSVEDEQKWQTALAAAKSKYAGHMADLKVWIDQYRKDHPFVVTPAEEANILGTKEPGNSVIDWIKRHLGAPQSNATTTPPGTPAPGSLANSGVGNLIGRGEGTYDSVNRGAKGKYKAGTENLSAMTVDDVMAAQKSGKFQAAGRYEIIPSTLKDAVAALGLTGREKFDKTLQDRIFEQYLVAQKRPAIADYIAGRSNDLRAAVKAGAAEWASIADPDTGKSRYAGTGNNRATISAEEFARALVNARAAQGAAASAPSVTINQAGAPRPNQQSPIAPQWSETLAAIRDALRPIQIVPGALSTPSMAMAAMYSNSLVTHDARDFSTHTHEANITVTGSGSPARTASAVMDQLRSIGFAGAAESGAA